MLHALTLTPRVFLCTLGHKHRIVVILAYVPSQYHQSDLGTSICTMNKPNMKVIKQVQVNNKHRYGSTIVLWCLFGNSNISSHELKLAVRPSLLPNYMGRWLFVCNSANWNHLIVTCMSSLSAVQCVRDCLRYNMVLCVQVSWLTIVNKQFGQKIKVDYNYKQRSNNVELGSPRLCLELMEDGVPLENHCIRSWSICCSPREPAENKQKSAVLAPYWTLSFLPTIYLVFVCTVALCSARQPQRLYPTYFMHALMFDMYFMKIHNSAVNNTFIMSNMWSLYVSRRQPVISPPDVRSG